MHVLKITEA